MGADGGPISAEDLAAELRADPTYAAHQEAQDRELRRKKAAWREAEAPLVEELRRAGFEIDSAWDLVNISTPYPDALPILLQHLERRYPDRVREGIARALAVRDARSLWDRLVSVYVREPAGTDAKDGLAVAVAAAADDEVLDQVIALAKDPQHGMSRLFLLRPLERSQAARAQAGLEELATDPELSAEVSAILERAQRKGYPPLG